MTAIDIHSHAMPLAVLGWLESTALADLSQISDGRVRIAADISGVTPGSGIPCPPEQYDPAARKAARARTRVSAEAISVPPFFFASNSQKSELVLSLAQRCNDALHEFVRSLDGPVAALYFVPLGHPKAVDEARRCCEELGGAGLTIGTYGMGLDIDDDVNEPLWEYLASRQVFTFVHPSRVSEPERLADFHLVQLFGYPVETALAASRLIFSGVLDRHDLRLCLSHGGGCLTGLGPRLDLGWQRKDVARTSHRPPGDYLKRFYYDTAVFDTGLLRDLVDTVGSDRVLLGTDFPFDLAERDPLSLVDSLGASDAHRAAIVRDNARRLLASGVFDTDHTSGAVASP